MKIRNNKNLKIIGDIMLDNWIYGEYGSLSAEAPLKIFKHKKNQNSLGGVGNLCSHLKRLNINFKLLVDIANDEDGLIIKKKLLKKNINYLKIGEKKITTKKNRFFVNDEQIFREDKEVNFSAKNINSKIEKKIKKNDFIIVSDYKKGIVNKNLHKILIKKKCITFIDPKNKPNFFKNAFLVKPNLVKFEEWCGKFNKTKAFNLLKKMNWHWLIITIGERGVHVFNKKGEYRYFRVKKVDKPNVIGAGDSFFAGLMYLILNGYDIFTAAEMSSYVSTKLVNSFNKRLITLKDFRKNVVFTNGVFDILHKGHIRLLKFARKIGKKLILGINSDRSTKINKGSTRPLNSVKIRIRNLKKLNIVDKIIIFNEKTPLNLIKKLKPDVIVKGDDYLLKDVVGKEVSNVLLFNKYKNYSTTKIIKRLKLN